MPMKLNNGAINVEPIAWNLMNNKTTRQEAQLKAEREKIDGIPVWIVATLKRYGNCYVNKIQYDLDKISSIVGFQIGFDRCMDGKGFILSKVGGR